MLSKKIASFCCTGAEAPSVSLVLQSSGVRGLTGLRLLSGSIVAFGCKEKLVVVEFQIFEVGVVAAATFYFISIGGIKQRGTRECLSAFVDRKRHSASAETEFGIKMHEKSASRAHLPPPHRDRWPKFMPCSSGNVIALCPCVCK